MIISHRYRYVYVETPRTGSRAVATELVQYYEGQPILHKHASYRDFLRGASADERSYFAFSGIRNPLDLAVSRFTELKTNEGGRFTDPRQKSIRSNLAGRLERRAYDWVTKRNATFEEFLLRWYLLPYDTWTSLDHHRLGAIHRFESLADDLENVLRLIGIEPVRRLPAVNVTEGRGRDYVSYYTPRARRRAIWVFGPYMEQWRYEFPAAWGQVIVPRWSRVLFRAAQPLRRLYWTRLRHVDYARRRVIGAPYGTGPGGITGAGSERGDSGQ